MPDLSNTTLGKYDVIREIGRGSMGVVYQGHDPFTGRNVAIKVALPESLQDERSGARYRKLFFNEAKVAGKLRHPNIVGVFDAGVEGEICYIVMELIAGGRTLFDHCQPASLLPIEDAVRVIFKSARALDYAHRQGVIHRDVKPRNILLTVDSEVKLSDFSIALRTQGDATDTQVHGYIGSPLYMSPEQVRDDTITNQSDIFSLGVVMYELLTGRHPFAADNLPAIAHRITEKRHTPLAEMRPDAPPILARILDRALCKQTGQRYRMGLDVAADLSLVYDHIKLLDEQLPGDEKFKLVRSLAFFDDFTEPEIWEVINSSGWLDFAPGSEIIAEGELDTSFYIIISGDVTVFKGEMEVDELHQGDCFGEMGFIARKERSATIIAKTGVTTMNVRPSMIERASLHCQLRFHKVFLSALVARLSQATERLSAGASVVNA
ncbi:MAG: cyclic nucleotide-binding domain-containing protein [Lysobacterales bacterium]|nr:MAG: cyclic nucleotide-binding domain-containing protein [Xanthomonadales bacterium]